MRKLNKAFSLVLALALCLGLTIPAFAAKNYIYTDTYKGITMSYTDTKEGRTHHVTMDCTGTGVFTAQHLYKPLDLGLCYGGGTLTINLGPGIVLEKSADFDEMLRTIESYGTTVKINNSDTGSSTQPQQPAGESAAPTNDKLEVNYVPADPTVYKIDGSNYFKIRDVAALLNGTEKQFSVGYDGSKNAVTLTRGQGYDKQPGDLAGAAKGGDQTAIPSNDVIYVDGEKITVEAYKINGSNYFKLRSLGKALNFHVGWSADRGMYIETGR